MHQRRMGLIAFALLIAALPWSQALGAPNLQLTQFNIPGNQQFVSSSPVEVKWNASDPAANPATPREALKINLYYSPTGQRGDYKLVAFNLPNPAAGDGTFTWYPPNRPIPNATGRFRVEAVNPTQMPAATFSQVTSGAFRIVSAPGGLLGTTLRDFDMPGTQPAIRGAPITSPSPATGQNCNNCHAQTDAEWENFYARWQGTMMATASIDPLFDACLEIANHDAPESGDLCIRCHVPKAWLEGRSTPTNGAAITTYDDKRGVQCEVCHRMVDPLQKLAAANPPVDQDILTLLGAAQTPPSYGNGMYVIDPNLLADGPFAFSTRRRGPFDMTANPVHAGHDTLLSPFTKSSGFCGTCHDVSNPALEVVDPKAAERRYRPKQAFDTVRPAADFTAGKLMPIERTYSEWRYSAFFSAPQEIPQFGQVQNCQDCHMQTISQKRACVDFDGGDPPPKRDLHMHDHTGGNTFITRVLRDAAEFLPHFANDAERKKVFGGMGVAPNNDGSIDRTIATLTKAATLDVVMSGDLNDIVVTVTNQTGHKLPTGYPEGRRMWLNVKYFRNGQANPIHEFGRYDFNTAT